MSELINLRTNNRDFFLPCLKEQSLLTVNDSLVNSDISISHGYSYKVKDLITTLLKRILQRSRITTLFSYR